MKGKKVWSKAIKKILSIIFVIAIMMNAVNLQVFAYELSSSNNDALTENVVDTQETDSNDQETDDEQEETGDTEEDDETVQSVTMGNLIVSGYADELSSSNSDALTENVVDDQETDSNDQETDDEQEETGDTEEDDETVQSVTMGNLIVSGYADDASIVGENEAITIYEASGDVIAVYEKGILTIKGSGSSLTISTDGTHNGGIVIDANADITLSDATIIGNKCPAIKVNAGYTSTITLDGTNSVTGAANYAGIQSTFDDGNLATVIIDGIGELTATGGSHSAGIGGSYTNFNSDGVSIPSYSGNIIINNGKITANSSDNAAGIGHAENNGRTWNSATDSYTGQNASFKMGTKSGEIGSITINGGTVTATGGGMAAGIGGGNHTDSGNIVVNGGTVTATGHTGIGCGYGSNKTANTNEKGPGYYYADITINGGTIVAKGQQGSDTNYGGAGIGGGMYSDAIIVINGGNITAVGGEGKSGSYHHGAAGIGGGYEGHASITIKGGTINATGGRAAAGIGSGAIANDNPNNTSGNEYKSRCGEVTVEYTDVVITGGNITANGGELGGAGIGGGVGADRVEISISGGDITAIGGSSSEELKRGGAGIGSGYIGSTSGESAKYFEETSTIVSVTNGSVTAVGGWGASGIGSGADNKSAESITIDANNAAVKAYSDGTKFAIDTRETKGANASVSGNMLQGTFVLPYDDSNNASRDTTGLNNVQVINDNTGTGQTLSLPEGYRSFATTLSESGTYTIYTDDESVVADGETAGRYFNKYTDEDYTKGEVTERNIQYAVNGTFSDNYWLIPVKTIKVTKTVKSVDDADLSELNQTLYFALWVTTDSSTGEGYYMKEDPSDTESDSTGAIWTQTITVKNGVPQNSAYFADVPDDTIFGIWELDENGNSLYHAEINGLIIQDIQTRQTLSGGDDNDASVSETKWNDTIEVINYYAVITDELNYDANGGEGTMEATIGEAESDVTVSANEFTREGYSFTGWNTEADGSGVAYEAGSSYTLITDHDDILYAQWEEEAQPVVPITVPTVDPTPPFVPTVVPNPVVPVEDPTPIVDPEPIVTPDPVLIDDPETPLVDPSLEVINDPETPLADGHSCCLLHFGLITLMLVLCIIYMKRRKSIQEDIEDMQDELLHLAEELGILEELAVKYPDYDITEILEEVVDNDELAK